MKTTISSPARPAAVASVAAPSAPAPSAPGTSEHGVLPLAPIDRPRGLFVRLLYWMTRRRYGTTPTAFRVVYARAPALALASIAFAMILDRGLSLPKELRFLVQIASATRKGCTFCADLMLAEAVMQQLGRERFLALDDVEGSARFDEAEKAAVAYAYAVSDSLEVPDAIFARLRRSFDERQITELVFLCAAERYFNGLALPLRIGSDHLADAALGARSTSS